MPPVGTFAAPFGPIASQSCLYVANVCRQRVCLWVMGLTGMTRARMAGPAWELDRTMPKYAPLPLASVVESVGGDPGSTTSVNVKSAASAPFEAMRVTVYVPGAV